MVKLEVSPIASLPVPRASLGRRLGLAEGFGSGASPAEDSALDGWIFAATAHLERRLSLLVSARACVWTLSAPRLERSGGLRFPVGPVSAIAECAVLESSGAVSSLWSGWRLEPDDLRASLRPAAGGSWPSLPTGGTLRISFTAGFSPLPADLAEAVLQLAAHWFEHREAAGDSLSETPLGLASLLAPYAPMRL